MYKLMERSKKMRNKKGFTLIELIVVIVIIGILAAIIIPRLSGFTDTAEKRAIEANMRTVDSSSMIYEADTGGVAATIAVLVGADLLQTAPATTGVVYALDGDGRCVATFAANVWGTHAAATALTVEEVKALSGW